MRFDEYHRHDAVGLAELVRRREVSRAELLQAAAARMAEVNPKVNAVVLDLTAEAQAEPERDGPLAGVPFLVKDLGASVTGAPTTGGSRMFAQVPAPNEDSALVRLYREAGLAIFGKTNTPEFGLWPVTESELLGPARNPWDLSRTPGGSSGGASAAVAAGIVPAAHATDGGGSIRIPASCTGLFGMKPSRGRVSFAPAGEGWAGASIPHAVTRSVRDSAVLLDAVCTPQPGDPYYLAPERPFADEVSREPGRLRIAMFDGALTPGRTLDPECAAAVREAGKLCEELGHHVEEARLPGDHAAMQAAAGVVIAASVAASMDAEAERRGRAVEDGDVEAMTMASYRRGRKIAAPEYVRAVQTLHDFGRAAAQLFERYDVFLCSTLGQPAIPVGWIFEDPKQLADRLFTFMPNTQAFNNTGQPAMTVPLAWSSGGLPIGVQFVAKLGSEATLFRLAGQLEQARPWFDRVAPL